jgi:hypothetical protein
MHEARQKVNPIVCFLCQLSVCFFSSLPQQPFEVHQTLAQILQLFFRVSGFAVPALDSRLEAGSHSRKHAFDS